MADTPPPAAPPEAPAPAPPQGWLQGVLSGNKIATAGLAGLALMVLIGMGYLTVTTPEAQQCQVDLADAKARLELLTEAKEACKAALAAFTDKDDE